MSYSSIVTALPFGRVYLNTIISTVVTTVVQVLFCSMAALWHLQESNVPFKNAIFLLVLSVLMVPGQIFLIPGCRIVQSLGLLDTIPALLPAKLIQCIWNISSETVLYVIAEGNWKKRRCWTVVTVSRSLEGSCFHLQKQVSYRW